MACTYPKAGESCSGAIEMTRKCERCADTGLGLRGPLPSAIGLRPISARLPMRSAGDAMPRLQFGELSQDAARIYYHAG